MTTDGRRGSGDPLATVRRQLLVVILCTLVAGAAATAVSLMRDKQYTATAVLLSVPQTSDSQSGSASSLPREPNREAQTNVELAELDLVADRTAERLGGGLSGRAVQRKVETVPRRQSDVLSVKATDESPRLAARLANTFAAEYVAFRDELRNRTATLELVQRARLPSDASSPKPVLTGVLAAVLGLILGTGIAFVRDRRDGVREEAEEAERLFSEPLMRR